MPIDRAATLRNAEKYLKQGKLDFAIAEYLRALEDQPRDWTTANSLGDLYVRAGQTDKAIEQFSRIADTFAAEGFLPKASALYKKILKLKPDDEHTLVQAAGIAAAQGLFVDARTYLKAVAERRGARGDARGVAEIDVRLGMLDPADYRARIAAAQARTRLGEVDGAIADLKGLAAELAGQERAAEAVEALEAAADLAPADHEIQRELFRAHVAAGNPARARDWARTPADYQAIASALVDTGDAEGALDLLRHAIARFPDETGLRADLARGLLAHGNVDEAAEFFDGDASEPGLSLKIAEAHFTAGRIEHGLGLLQRLVEQDPLQRDAIALLAWQLEARSPATTFAVIDLVVVMSVAQEDYNWASLALQEFVRRTPGHLPALRRLVDVCVEGGLVQAAATAQAQLVDAYLDAGAAADARVIAEDLARRHPSTDAHVDRLRRALEMTGEPDPDSVVAELLAASSESDALDAGGDSPQPESRLDAELEPAEGEPASFALTSSAIDIEALLRELEGPPSPRTAAVPPHVEVDLSVVLDSIKPAAPSLPQSAPLGVPGEASSDLNAVFGQLRREATARRPASTAEADYARGAALLDAGDADGALEALAAAANSPAVRFRAASLAARICRASGRATLAIEWLERAVEATAPSAEQAYAVLYELAGLLEEEGEAARALAVCLELQAAAGGYRDVSARVDRLARVTARG